MGHFATASYAYFIDNKNQRVYIDSTFFYDKIFLKENLDR